MLLTEFENAKEGRGGRGSVRKGLMGEKLWWPYVYVCVCWFVQRGFKCPELPVLNCTALRLLLFSLLHHLHTHSHSRHAEVAE